MMKVPWLWEALLAGTLQAAGLAGERSPYQVKDELKSALLGQCWVRTPRVWRLCLLSHV